MSAARRRCAWATNPLSIAYHDREWGVPVREDRKLFEFLLLEGAQAHRRGNAIEPRTQRRAAIEAVVRVPGP